MIKEVKVIENKVQNFIALLVGSVFFMVFFISGIIYMAISDMEGLMAYNGAPFYATLSLIFFMPACFMGGWLIWVKTTKHRVIISAEGIKRTNYKGKVAIDISICRIKEITFEKMSWFDVLFGFESPTALEVQYVDKDFEDKVTRFGITRKELKLIREELNYTGPTHFVNDKFNLRGDQSLDETI